MDPRMQRPTLTAASVALVVVMLNVSIVNPALPDLARDLRAGSTLGWAVGAYTLALATLLLAGGVLGDRLGHRRVLLAGLGVSALGALLAATAPSFAVLLAGRAVQGVGSALVQPATLALLTHAFSTPRERARAFALWGAVSGLGIALGPVVGGVLVDAVGWHGPFALLTVACLLALPVAARVGFETPPVGRGDGFDMAGLVLSVTALGSAVLALGQGAAWGWGSPPVLALLAVAALALVAFLHAERRAHRPLVDLGLRRVPGFAAATVTGLLAFLATFGLLPFLTVFLQTHLGLSATRAGLIVLCFPLGFALGSALSGQLTVARGPRATLLVGLGLAAISSLLWRGLQVDGLPGAYALNFGAWGAGLGLSLSALTVVALAKVPAGQAGMASGVLNTARQLGTALGVAAFGTLVSSAVTGDAYAAGLHLAAALAGCALLAGLVLCLTTLPGPGAERPMAAALRTAEEEA